MGLVCVKDTKLSDLATFTDEEKKRIKKVWNKAIEREVIMTLLVAVITQKPQFASLFDVEDLNESHMLNSAPLICHATKIRGFIDNVVLNLDELTLGDIRKRLYAVGVNHYHKKVNFDAGNYLTFKKHFMTKICEGVDHRTMAAWFKLLGLMIKEMKNGYYGEALRYNTNNNDIKE